MNTVLHNSEFSSGYNYSNLFAAATAPLAIYKGRDLRYVFVNDAYSKIFNNTPRVGKTVRDAFPGHEGQQYFKFLEGVYDTGIPFFDNETPALLDVHDNGVITRRYYHLVYSPFINDDGAVDGVMAFGHDVTGQVETRRKERESDLRFRNIVEQSIDPILILKGKELILDVANDALLKLWNVGRDAIGKPFLTILPEMKDQEYLKLLLDVYHNGTTHYGFESPAYFNRFGGKQELFYFSFIYQPYREGDGTISGVLVLSADVTGQVQAKQKLAQSEVNFRNIILQAPVAMCVLEGPEFVVQIANKRMYDLWGKPESQMLHKPIFEGLPEAKGQGLEKLLKHVFTTGLRYVANERMIELPRNGKTETVYINFVYEAVKSSDGNISGLIVVASEVTELVVARHKVEYAEENARLAIESAELGTYEVNLLNNEIIASQRFNAIWGFEQPTNNRSDFTARIHPEDRATREQAHKESLKTGDLHYEARITRKDGITRWIKAKGKVLYDKQGTPTRLLGVIQDITEMKDYEEALAKKVEERTDSLKEANQRLKRSNEELEEFAYIASHDLQEPLRKIQLFNTMIMGQAGLPDKAKYYIDKISASAIRMTGLIRDLLEYSRLSQQSLRFEKTDLNLIISNILTDYELLISQKNAVVEVATLPIIDAIPLQMNQLFFNLIGNALKFAKKHVTPVITVTADYLSEERKHEYPDLNRELNYLEVKVTDNGIGFNQEYANKIFTIFQKLNEKSLYGGYGIGLAICRKIIDNHAGIIYAEGRLKEGASFILIIPCVQNQH